MTHRTVLTASLLLLWSSAASSQTSYPMLGRIDPTAVQRGSTVEVTIAGGGTGGAGSDFSGAFAVLCQGPGLSGKVVAINEPDSSSRRGRSQRSGTNRRNVSVNVSLAADKDCPLGPREVRVATPQGVSSVGLVVVVDDPIVRELDDKANDGAAGAQAVTPPCVVTGVIGKTEDSDWYSFGADAGQTMTFSAWANRLQNKVHDLQTHFDPILVLRDAAGRELAADDNTDFADPRLTYQFKQRGTYWVEIRDTTYGGNANWTYALQMTAGPVASSIFPLALNPGKITDVHVQGANIDALHKIPVEVPLGAADGPLLISLRTERGSTLPAPVVVTSLPVIQEAEDASEDPEKAQEISLPSAITGRLQANNDGDGYKFEAKKGAVYSVEAVARRAGAGTDPVLRITDAKGAAVAEADDSPGLGKDCRLEWTAPSDGKYTIHLTDLHSRGGDEFGYVILAEPAKPDFLITCDPDKLNVGLGGRVPLFVQAARRGGFAGPITVAFDSLPAGVTASPLTIPPAMTQGVIIVSAATDAARTATLPVLKGKAEVAGGPLVREASPKEEIYLPGGGRGVYPVETLALGVTDPSDISVAAVQKSLTLKPGGTAAIDVEVTRREGYEQGVNLAIVLQHLGGTHANPLPPGVTVKEAGSKTLLGPKETRGKILLQAADNAAAIENVPICVMGHVSINFVVKTAYASEPISVTVAPK